MTSMKSKAPVKTNESGVRGKVLPKATKTRRDYGDKKKMYTHGPLAEDTTEADSDEFTSVTLQNTPTILYKNHTRLNM